MNIQGNVDVLNVQNLILVESGVNGEFVCYVYILYILYILYLKILK